MAETSVLLDESPGDGTGSSAGPKNVSPKQIIKVVLGALGLIVMLEILRRAVITGTRHSYRIQQWWRFYP